jgi:methyltransferase (TIGR00027 family)
MTMAGTNGPVVSNVSDTARWVAVYRAWESARKDALFHDPFAERLAGEQGKAIAALVPRAARNGWPMVARTKLIDDLVLASIREGCDRVLNLAAGLDTRPYRLELPSSLGWVEADLPAMIDEKERLLQGERPRCRLSREKVDLADPAARSAFLSRVTAGAARVLVLTEGLLVYLGEEVVRSFSGDLQAVDPIHWWMLDVMSPAVMEMMNRGMGSTLSQAPLRFAPPNGLAFFESLGWVVRDAPSVFKTAAQHRRLPWMLRPFALLPEPDPRNLGRARWSAVVRLERPGVEGRAMAA